MTSDDLFKGLLNLSEKMMMKTPLNAMDTAIVIEAAAFVLEQIGASQVNHPSTQTSNGDPVATFFNNVVNIKKAGL